jgi:hypothetical protein
MLHINYQKIIIRGLLSAAVLILCLITITTGQEVWSLQNSGTQNALRGSTWGDSLFIVVGDSGTILSSPDGIVWTSRTSGTQKKLSRITWGDSLFIVVGDSGTILESSNGIAWSGRTSGTSKNLRDVTWGDSLFVAVGDSGTILTSPDGSVWTDRTFAVWGPNPSFGKCRFNAIAWGNNLFVAVGTDLLAAGALNYFTSPDGITWNGIARQRYVDLNDVTWTGNLFVITALDGMRFPCPMSIIYTSRTCNLGCGVSVSACTMGAGEYVAVGTNILTSPDNTVWTERQRPVGSGPYSLNDVTYGDSIYIAVGSYGTIITSIVTSSAIKNEFGHALINQPVFSISNNMIRYSLPSAATVSIILYTIHGRLVYSLVNCMRAPGKYSVAIPSNLPNSSYILSFTAGGKKIDRKVLIVR